jgi:hypothetical protein
MLIDVTDCLEQLYRHTPDCSARCRRFHSRGRIRGGALVLVLLILGVMTGVATQAAVSRLGKPRLAAGRYLTPAHQLRRYLL